MTELQPLNTSPLPVKLRLEDYLLLGSSGTFDAYAKTELIEGEILFMNAQHRPHSYAKSELAYRLRRALEALSSPLYVITEGSVALSRHSAPEPDIVLTSEPIGAGLIPLPSVFLLIEVADTTATSDLQRKAVLYAEAQVPEYWVVDLSTRTLHQMWSPQPGAYAEQRAIRLGSPIEAVTIAGLAVETDGVA